MMMKRHLHLTLALLALPAAGLAADITAPSSITGNVTWTRNNVYHLDGKVWIESGAILTIEAGTVIKGLPKSDPALASALIATRGGKLNAMGTANAPIIFTAESDTLNGNLAQTDRGLWGGLVLLGNGAVNTTTGQGSLEGLPAGDTRSVYGGGASPNDNDSSGELHYVSIRHCGAVVATNVELNGLSMGGVGRGTKIDHIEVYACNDDGYEWWGGAVECKYLVSAFNDDDNFDWDEGFHGKGQFWFAIQDAAVGNQFFELDGGTTPENGTPFSIPTVYNVTVIGSGALGTNTNNQGLLFRDNSGGKIYNGLFTDCRGYAARIETESAQGASNDSAARLAAGDLVIANCIFGTFGAGVTDDLLFRAVNVTVGGPVPASNYVAAHINGGAQANRINTDPLIRGISRTANAGLDPRPQAASPALTGAAAPPDDGFFTSASYVGAFGNYSWLGGWTALDHRGYLAAAQFASGIDQEFSNVSTRCFVGTGDNVAIPGFIIAGTEPKRVLIRAVGKRLQTAPFNLTTALDDTTLEVYSGSTLVYSNDNWGDNQNATAIADTSVALGIGLYPIDPSDAAVLVTLAPGAYTVQVRGKNSATGLAIVEVYGAD